MVLQESMGNNNYKSSKHKWNMSTSCGDKAIYMLMSFSFDSALSNGSTH